MVILIVASSLLSGCAHTIRTTQTGQDISGHALYTDVFAKRHGAGQAVAEHASRPPQ
jgi:uncharacterized protein YceK